MKLKTLFSMIIAGLILSSCGPVENSSALDDVLYGPTIDLTGSTPLFSTVRASLTKCQTCHGSWLSMSEAQFISLGLVVAGSPNASKIYYRNLGATAGPGPRNMPAGGYPALSSAELQNMIDWINGL